MKYLESPIWFLIAKFPYDAPHPVETFPQRLARCGGWSDGYTLEIIEEYKKFLYLCATSKSLIAPSSTVDMAWSIHMDFYPENFRSLHQFISPQHLERKQFFARKSHQQFWLPGREWFISRYRQTQSFYRKIFGAPPPANIWLREDPEFQENRTTSVNLGNLLIFDIDARFICVFLGLLGLAFSFAFKDSAPLILGVIAGILCYFKHPAMNRDYDQANDGKGYRNSIP